MLQDNITKLEPLLAALAAVPWIDPGAEEGRRVPFIKTTVLDQVEGMGMLHHPHICMYCLKLRDPFSSRLSVLRNIK